MVDAFPKRITKWAQVQALKDEGRLTAAELALIDGAKAGERAVIGTTVPNTKTDAVLIRAPLIRYLALGGCEDCRVEAEGVQVAGAWIDGPITLNYATAKRPLKLIHCHIADRIGMLQCTLPVLNLTGSTLPEALDAQDAQIAGGVFLREASVDGEVRLSGATIGGQLSCDGASFRNVGGHALNAQAAQIAEDVFLVKVIADGELSLSGATIGGQLACLGASFRNAGGYALNAQATQIAESVFLREATVEGEVRLSGATIGGQLACEGASFRDGDGLALNLQRLVVKDGFYWREVKAVTGRVDLNSAHVADMMDDAASWAKCDTLSLANLTYETIAPDVTITQRLDWLRKGAVWNGDFHPQPYEQLAKVLRNSGHRSEARTILVAKEKAQRQATRALRVGWLRFRTGVHWLWDWVLWGVIGYGYRPQRSVYVLLTLIFAGWVMAHQAWEAGDFAPNSDVILDSDAWQTLAIDRAAYPNPAKEWSDRLERGQDYATFNAIYYAVDTVVPIISLGQEAAWAPSTNRGPWGWWLWFFNPILTILGWIVTAIGAAAVTGVIRRD